MEMEIKGHGNVRSQDLHFRLNKKWLFFFLITK